MTVANQTFKVIGSGNDSATSFSFSPMVLPDSSDQLVVIRTDANGVETTLTEENTSTGYAVVVSSFPGTGSVTYPASGGTPLPTGETLTMKRVLTLEQQLDLFNQGGWFPETQELSFDRLVMIDLQQQETLDRSFAFPVSYNGGASAEIPIPEAGSVLRWNSGATGLENATDVGDTLFTLPVSTTDNAVVRWDGTGGTAAQDSGVTIDDSDNLDVPGALTLGTELAVAEGGTGGATAAAARTNLAVPGTATANTFTATQTWSKGADVASANALTLGSDGNYFDITGTTSITSIATKGVGTVVKLHFDAALTLTHDATDLILPGGANITTAAGDEAELIEYASGDWRCTNYVRAASKPWRSWVRTSSATTSGTSVDITSIASGTDEIVIALSGVSQDSASQTLLLQLGDSGGVEASGYSGSSIRHVGTSTHTYTNNSAGFIIGIAIAAADITEATILLHRVSGNIWTVNITSDENNADQNTGMGLKTLTAELDRVRLTTAGGSATFDAGTMYVMYR